MLQISRSSNLKIPIKIVERRVNSINDAIAIKREIYMAENNKHNDSYRRR